MFQGERAKAKRRIEKKGFGLIFSLAFLLFVNSSVSPCFAMARRPQPSISLKNTLTSFKQKIISIFTRDPVQPVYVSPQLPPETTPRITNLSPQDGSSFYEGDSILISPTATNPKQTNLEYQFSIDGKIKQSWSNKSNYTCNPVTVGNHHLKVELRDSAGNKNTKEIDIFVFRKPISTPD